MVENFSEKRIKIKTPVSEMIADIDFVTEEILIAGFFSQVINETYILLYREPNHDIPYLTNSIIHEALHYTIFNSLNQSEIDNYGYYNHEDIVERMLK